MRISLYGLSLFGLFLLSKEFFILNEEAILLFCFVVLVGYLYNNISSLVSGELDARSAQVKKEFLYYTNVKREKLETLIQAYKKISSLKTDISVLSSGIYVFFISLASKKKRVLISRIRSNFNKKLESLSSKEQLVVKTINKSKVAHYNARILKEIKENGACRELTTREAIFFLLYSDILDLDILYHQLLFVHLYSDLKAYSSMLQ